MHSLATTSSNHASMTCAFAIVRRALHARYDGGRGIGVDGRNMGLDAGPRAEQTFPLGVPATDKEQPKPRSKVAQSKAGFKGPQEGAHGRRRREIRHTLPQCSGDEADRRGVGTVEAQQGGCQPAHSREDRTIGPWWSKTPEAEQDPQLSRPQPCTIQAPPSMQVLL